MKTNMQKTQTILKYQIIIHTSLRRVYLVITNVIEQNVSENVKIIKGKIIKNSVISETQTSGSKRQR